METKQPNFDEQLAFSRIVFRDAPIDQDYKGIDSILDDIPLAFRKRKRLLSKYNDITIRHTNMDGKPSEYFRFLNGEANAIAYFFIYPDALVIIEIADLIGYIKKNHHKLQPRTNPDGLSKFVIIPLTEIRHFLIKRRGG